MNAFQGPPAVSFYSMLSGLGDTIQENQKNARAAAVDNARKSAFSTLDPNSKDFGQVAMTGAANLLKAGDIAGGTHMLTLAQAQAERDHQRVREGETDRHTGVMEGLATRAANRADEDKFVVKEVTNPDGSSGFVRIRTTGAQGPVAGVTPPPAAPVDASLSGPDYLKTLPANRAAIVKKLADHEILPQYLSIAGGHREGLLADVARYDPGYDASLAPARFAAKKEFMSGGPNSPAATIVSGGTTIGHLLHASEASQKLGGTDGFGPLNSTINAARAGYGEASNDPNLKEYNTTIGRIAEEGTKFYRGVGGTESDIQRDIATMKPGQSPEARDRALATQASLIYSKVAALQDRYKTAMGTSAWEKLAKENNFPVISAKNREAVNVILKRGGLQPLPVENTGQGNGADVMIQHAKDAMPASAPPPAAAIAALKQDPRRAADFDAYYGAGSSDAILRGIR